MQFNLLEEKTMLKTYNKHNLDELEVLENELKEYVLAQDTKANDLFYGTIEIREKHPDSFVQGKLWRQECVDSVKKCEDIISYMENLIIINDLELQIDCID